MTNFFEAKTIAIIGASANPQKLGHQLLKNLIKTGFRGTILPINLDEKKILGLPVFTSVLDIQRKVDLAVIIIPREATPTVLTQCVLKEIPYVLIISAGFAEKDALGKRLQTKLLDITRNSRTKVIGPNCLGIVDTGNKLNLTFAAAEVIKGDIGLILQSGAIGAAIFDWAKINNVGISKFASLGNKIHLNEIDLLEIMGQDPQTKMIALYLEEISDPAKFLVKAREISLKKPLLILKGGATLPGQKAALSHTAALSTLEELNTALFCQANLIVAENFEELLSFLELFSSKTFDIQKNSLAIVTNAGGPGILAADAASRHQFRLPKLSIGEKRQITKILPNFASLENPFDLGGDAKALNYQKILELLDRLPKFSSILAIVTPQTATEIEKTAKIFVGFAKKSRKALLTAFMGGSKVKKANEILIREHVANYEDPSLAIGLLAKVYTYWRRRQNSPEIKILPVEYQTITSDQELIQTYGIPFVKTHEVFNDAEVVGTVEEMNFPLVYKSSWAVHRGKAGRVGLNISDQAALMRAIAVIGYPGIIQEMIDSPYEIIIGAKRHPHFGPVLVFGQGGIFTEETNDISFKILPLTEADLNEMIEETKVWQSLKDFKVKPLIKDVITKTAQIMLENQDIQEFELNPIKVLSQKIIAVDINTKRRS